MYMLVCMLVCWVCEGAGSFAGAWSSLAQAHQNLETPKVVSGGDWVAWSREVEHKYTGCHIQSLRPFLGAIQNKGR